jgi:hypothetical protein
MEESCMKKEKAIDKRIFKKTPEELQLYMYFKKRGFKIENKKGKGSYERRPKHVGRAEYDN